MSMQTMISTLQRALLDSEIFWKEETQKETDVKSFIQAFVLPVVVLTAVVSGLLTMLFGYRIPMLGVIRPGLSDMLIQMVGMVVLYILSLLILGWIAAYLAKLFGGKEDFAQAVKMIFWISVPSLLGQILGTLPYVGWIIALGLGLYSLVLLYRAIPVFLNVSLENRVKHFILFMISAFVVSVVLNITVGRLFVPHDMLNQMRSDTLPQSGIPAEIDKEEDVKKEQSKSAEDPVGEYVEAMTKGDNNKEIISDSADDTFIPPTDGKLSKAQVERFIALAKRVKKVEQEQAQRLKEKYEAKEKQEDFSISDIFNGLKDFTNLATLEMKVVKANGGNWAEYQWVKERVREAYYTPSLSKTTEYNAKLIKEYEEVIKGVL